MDFVCERYQLERTKDEFVRSSATSSSLGRESSPIDLLIGRKTIKKFDLFNQVPSQLKDFDEEPITVVLKPLESVKISRDCQPRVALLPTQSTTKEF